ncbi:hypothetical protein [Cytobacillus oceanisediminis]|uniref:hypothetical protein n=1 Tax=Cytobacillus oceanisediminis TaxID=665099 RepID=UPI00207A9A57|nr:hypothetical protein [Cytobacillus oceanisediminis]USK45823.1 hypothetical protein LIT27_08225 [Cytobacillus oceanisediminis]
MENIQFTTVSNFLIARGYGKELMVNIGGNKYQVTITQYGKHIPFSVVTCFGDELREKVHEDILEIVLNEFIEATTNMDEVVEVLDSGLNKVLGDVVQEGSSHSILVH